MVGIYPHTSAAALVTKNASATKPVLEKKRAGKAQLEVAHARVENVAVSVRSQYIGGKKPACTSEQLGKLATIASSRVR